METMAIIRLFQENLFIFYDVYYFGSHTQQECRLYIVGSFVRMQSILGVDSCRRPNKEKTVVFRYSDGVTSISVRDDTNLETVGFERTWLLNISRNASSRIYIQVHEADCVLEYLLFDTVYNFVMLCSCVTTWRSFEALIACFIQRIRKK